MPTPIANATSTIRQAQSSPSPSSHPRSFERVPCCPTNRPHIFPRDSLIAPTLDPPHQTGVAERLFAPTGRRIVATGEATARPPAGRRATRGNHRINPLPRRGRGGSRTRSRANTHAFVLAPLSPIPTSPRTPTPARMPHAAASTRARSGSEGHIRHPATATGTLTIHHPHLPRCLHHFAALSSASLPSCKPPPHLPP